jgi:hypothetical protein
MVRFLNREDEIRVWVQMGDELKTETMVGGKG